jgi:hypothetical protein
MFGVYKVKLETMKSRHQDHCPVKKDRWLDAFGALNVLQRSNHKHVYTNISYSKASKNLQNTYFQPYHFCVQ